MGQGRSSGGRALSCKALDPPAWRIDPAWRKHFFNLAYMACYICHNNISLLHFTWCNLKFVIWNFIQKCSTAAVWSPNSRYLLFGLWDCARLFATVSDNVRLCATFLRLSATMCECLQPYANRCVWLCATMSDFVRLYAPRCDCLRQYSTMCEYVRLYAPICDCLRLSAIVCDCLRLRLCAAMCDCVRLFATVCDCVQPCAHMCD